MEESSLARSSDGIMKKVDTEQLDLFLVYQSAQKRTFNSKEWVQPILFSLLPVGDCAINIFNRDQYL